MSMRALIIGSAVMSIAWPCAALADAPDEQPEGSPAAQSYAPRLLGEQYTFVLQHQSSCIPRMQAR